MFSQTVGADLELRRVKGIHCGFRSNYSESAPAGAGKRVSLASRSGGCGIVELSKGSPRIESPAIIQTLKAAE